jgi:hypothetical protein
MGDGVQWVGAAVASFAAVVLAVPVIDILFQFAQPRPGNPDSEVLAAVSIPVAYIVLLIELLTSMRPQR